MSIDVAQLTTEIRRAKVELRESLPQVASVFAELEAGLHDEIEAIAARRMAGEPVVPEVRFIDIVAGSVPQTTIDAIRTRGCAIVRGVFARDQAERWNTELGEYLIRNSYEEKSADRAGLDRYFSTLGSSRPQIFGIYWSKAQIAARQSPELAATRAWLSRLWRWQGDGVTHFNPDRQCSYADRIRRREAGDRTLGLSPHMDGGSIERWLDPAFRRVYQHVFAGNITAFDPFDAAHRTEVKEIPSPAVCRMFRTYQGWTALTEQGPGDGTLRLLPIARSVAYLLLRPLLDDVPDDSLCGAEAGRALALTERWHSVLVPGLVSIPTVYPGDTVWWHPDVIHAVEDENTGASSSNVMYISAAPDCAKNRAFLELQKPAFIAGRSSPDFAPEDYEVDFAGRAELADLTPLGRAQMGFAAGN